MPRASVADVPSETMAPVSICAASSRKVTDFCADAAWVHVIRV